jgi:hypothetical protein
MTQTRRSRRFHRGLPMFLTFLDHLRMKAFVSLAVISLAFVSPSWAETYSNWLARCKSYKDVANWLNENFYCDGEDARGQNPGKMKSPPARSAEEVFRRKTGISLDAAQFAKDSLNRINPEYRAEVFHLGGEKSRGQYVCGFHVGGRLFVMDYANPREKIMGTHGPFRNLGEYVDKFYPKNPSTAARQIPNTRPDRLFPKEKREQVRSQTTPAFSYVP